MTASHEANILDDRSSDEEPPMSLLEVEPGVAVLFADRPPADLDFFAFSMMSAPKRQELVDKLGVSVGAINVLAQGVQGAVSAQGLVRLAPETLAGLKTAKPMVSGGWNLGSLVSNGKIVSSVRWAPAVGAQSASVLAALGPAAALLAVQLQLASISRRVDENIDLTRDVLKALHEDQWATLVGLYDTTIRAAREAQIAGTVNDHIFASVASSEADLRKQRHLFAGFAKRHIDALDTDAKSRRVYLQKNIEQILADAHGLLMAEGSWYRSQVLRAGLISHDSSNSDENERLLAGLVKETEREHTKAMKEVARLLGDLERQCRLLVELPGDFSIPFTSKRRNIRDAVAMSSALAERVAVLRNRPYEKPAALEPAVVAFDGEPPAEVLRILSLVLPEGSDLLALADVNLGRLVGENAYLAITREQVLLTGQGPFRKQGAVERTFTLTDIRYVRFIERAGQGPVLDVITRAENVRLTFDSWAAKGAGLEGARRIGTLLASAMNLPEEERPTDPLLELANVAKRAITP
jgi:hypothetical protein